MNARTYRPAYTLIELLVVIFVISLLVLLVLPAVQAARESARRITCMSNLHNIGLAIHQHAEVHGTFPAGIDWPPSGSSYLVQVLPHLEQYALYNSLNLTDFVDGDVNMTVSKQVIATFLCPSDSRRATVFSEAATNYAGNCGNSGGSDIRGNGAFIGKKLAPRDFADGLSQTAGVSEWIVGPGDRGREHRLGSFWQITTYIARDDRAAFVQACEALDPGQVRPTLRAFKGDSWHAGGLTASLYNHVLTPNRPSCGSIREQMTGATAGSFHGSGAQVLAMDGSVHFVKETIDPQVWAAVGSRSAGEIVEGGAFD